MRLTGILSETWRNYVRGASHPLALALAVFAVIVIPAELEMSTTADLIHRTRDYEQAYASTYLINAPAGIDPTGCEKLATTGLVSAAGALRTDRSVSLTVLPAQNLPVYGATPGFLHLVGISPDVARATGAVAVATELWDTLRPPGHSQRPTDPVPIPPLTIADAYPWPADGRTPTLGSAVLAPTPPVGPFDQCWARAEDPTTDPRWLLPAVLLPGTDANQVRQAQVNLTLGQLLDTPTQFTTRPTQRAPYIAALATLLLAAVATWTRRIHIADTRELGLPTLSSIIAQNLEALTWALTGTALAIPALFWRAHHHSPPDQHDLINLTIPILTATLTTTLLATTLTTLLSRRRPVTDHLRTR
ncbi:MAG: hypothetical protein Q4F65_11885 [Propionibacteriaceae bacterium]|nr:hypothetical protein [Propionibacteriaceae bacterium]